MSMRQQFLRDGCLHLPGALDEATLADALECWQWSIEHPGRGAARVYQDTTVRVPDVAHARSLEHDESGFFYQDLSHPRTYPIYRELVRSRSILHILQNMLELHEAWFIGEQVFLKENETPPTGWHQDISDVSARGDDLVVLWLPFDSVDEETSLALVRGSHRGPVYSSIYGQYRAEPIPDVDANPDQFERIAFACEPGDVVVFHLSTLHGGGPTRAGQRRRALALRFVGPDATFESRLDPGDVRNGTPYRNDGVHRVC